MHQIVREFEAAHLKQDEFDFRPGDTVRVSVRIVEGGKERTQDFEGVCIRRQGGGMGETFTVRRVSYGVGMERIFPLHSPRLEGIRVVRRGKVRRANLNYLRRLSGKKARITEDLLRSRKMAGKKAERLRALVDMQGGTVTTDATTEAQAEASGESNA
ncbi:50S ribosomal protein L19 [Candidatus Sumerlaeota bacterium]|nr:50S ribosomal protein L19 [Candidatus Sumerlaeota bacterium]